MKIKVLASLVLTSSLLFSSLVAAEGGAPLSKPSEKVQKLINKYQLKVVGFKYAKQKVAKGTRNGAKSIFIDARPEGKYKKSTIPSSLNIPDTKYKDFVSQLKDVSKNKELIVFCGGWKCGKSPKVAGMLKKDGFTNVKLYQAGEPEWIKKSYKEVDVLVVKAAQSNNSAVLIDARPYKMFLKSTIPGSISIPDTDVEKLKGRFPVHQNEKIIVYCGGYKCGKSHKVAKKLISMGYRNVAVFAGGLPVWKKVGLSTTGNKSKKTTLITEIVKPKFSKNGIKIGSDEGSVDGEWFYSLIKANKVPSNVQIIDVTSKEEFKIGHLKGAINIHAETLKAKEFYSRLPKGKSIIFNCTAGGRSLEAWMKLNDEKFNISEIFYFDANIDCKGTECKIEVNEPLE
jgi:rhodanese-related sulfurtransferase